MATFGGVEVLLKLATFACQGAQAGVDQWGREMPHSTPPFAGGVRCPSWELFWELHWPRIFFFKGTFWFADVCYLSYFVMPQEKKQTGPGKRNLFGRSKDSYITVFFVVPCDRKLTGPHGPSGSTGSASFTIVCGHCFTPFAQKWTLQGCLGAGEGPGPQDWIWVWLFEKRNQRKVTRWNLLQIVLFIVHPSPCFLFHDVFLHQGWDTPGFIPMSRVSLQVGEGIGHRRTVWESLLIGLLHWRKRVPCECIGNHRKINSCRHLWGLMQITGVLQMNARRVPSPLAEQWSQRAREGGGHQRTARKVEALTRGHNAGYVHLVSQWGARVYSISMNIYIFILIYFWSSPSFL